MPYAPVHVENPRDVDATVIVGHCAEVRSYNFASRAPGGPELKASDLVGEAHAFAVPAGATLDTVPWLDSGCAAGAALPLYAILGTEVIALPGAWSGEGWSARLDPGVGTAVGLADLQTIFAADPAGGAELWIFGSLLGAWAAPTKAKTCSPAGTAGWADLAGTIPLRANPTPAGESLVLPASGVARSRWKPGGKCVPGVGRGVAEIWPDRLATQPAEVLVRACDKVAVLGERTHLVGMAEQWNALPSGVSTFTAWGLPFALDPACPVTLAKRHVTHSTTYIAGPFVPTGPVLVIPFEERWRMATPEEDAAMATWPGWAAFIEL